VEHVGLNRRHIARRKPVFPRRVGNSVHGHRPAPLEDEQRQDRSLLSATEREHGSASADLERAKDANA